VADLAVEKCTTHTRPAEDLSEEEVLSTIGRTEREKSIQTVQMAESSKNLREV
jgi:hypothetical protein